jgi:protein TonB
VVLEVTITPDGHIEKIKPVEGHPLLLAAAMDAVKRWEYQATLLNGNPVTVLTLVTVPFELNP